MKLNPDCVRDILLTIEQIPDVHHHWEFDRKTVPELFPNYTFDEIIYHIRQCELCGFLLYPSHSMGYEYYSVNDLTPAGHEFLANIRNDTFFNKVKDIAKELGVNSLNDITQIALNCALVLIKSHFQIL